VGRLFLAFRSFFKILFNREFAGSVRELTAPKVEEEPEEVVPLNEDAVQLLGLFQREGRLVDFICEDVQQFDDAQIGAAARSVHEGCRKVMDEYFELEPVMSEQEGSIVTIQEGFDPSTVSLVGNVAGEPPFRGTLTHHGWRAVKGDLPSVPEGQDKAVVGPAEVEVQ